MKTIRTFYLKICQFLVVKFSVYLNRRVFVMYTNFSMFRELNSLGRVYTILFKGGNFCDFLDDFFANQIPSETGSILKDYLLRVNPFFHRLA